MTPEPVIDLRTALRLGTADTHARLETAPLSRRVMADDVTMADYAAFLAATRRVLAPLALRVDAMATPEMGDGLRLAPLLDALSADLARMGAAPPPDLDLDFGALSGPADRLGALYVAEGSAMGGGVIARHLSLRLGPGAVPADGYLSRAKTDSGARWKAWVAAVRARTWAEAEVAGALRAAETVFGAFHAAYGGVASVSGTAAEADRARAG